MSKYIRHRRSREERNVFWGLIGASARTGWRLRHGESDRGTTTGRFYNKYIKGTVKDVVKSVKHNLEGADISRDIKKAAKSPAKVVKTKSGSASRRRRK